MKYQFNKKNEYKKMINYGFEKIIGKMKMMEL